MYSRGKNIAKLVNGLNQLTCQQLVGDILITAQRTEAYNGIEFNKKLKKLNKTLRGLSPKGVSIVTRSDGDRLHCHIAAEMPSQCTNFDWISFEESERYYILYKKHKYKADLQFFRYFTAKYRRSLPADWQIINHKLMGAGKKLGLGRIFLTPVRKNMTAYKWYLVSNIPYRRSIRDKGVHFFQSWGLVKTGNLQVVNKYTRDYRARLEKTMTGLQLNSDSYNIVLRSVLGKNWYFRISDLVKDINNLSTDQTRRYIELQRSLRLHLLRST